MILSADTIHSPETAPGVRNIDEAMRKRMFEAGEELHCMRDGGTHLDLKKLRAHCEMGGVFRKW